MKNVELKIEGMKCEGCVNRIKNVLSKIKGIESYEISLENKSLTVSLKNDKVLDEIIEKVQALDFEITKQN